jgi:hypothetical protein
MPASTRKYYFLATASNELSCSAARDTKSMQTANMKPSRVRHNIFPALLATLLAITAAQSSSFANPQSSEAASHDSSTASSTKPRHASSAQSQSHGAPIAQTPSSASAEAHTSSSATSQDGGVGRDCTRSSRVCRRGLLCLASSNKSAVSRVCRRPKKFEACDLVAHCDDSDPNVTLGCRKVFNIPSRAFTSYFPGRTCTQLFGRGQRCDWLYNDCLPGLTCDSKFGCVSVSRAKLDEDCSKADCVENLICKMSKGGSRRCASYVPEGQPCNLKEYVSSVNPCRSDSYTLRCIKGKCTRSLLLGDSCTLPDDEAQCDHIMSGVGTSCLKAETGALKCLTPQESAVGPCGDSLNIGCAKPGMQCIKGYCGVPNGGQGDVCGPRVACRSGLKCLKSSNMGAGSRCTNHPGIRGLLRSTK